ncbi:MAG: hypothetical protein IKM08_04075 [Clostridia bacterium]|nr:hypothetical protein [Clostridia bacterium]
MKRFFSIVIAVLTVALVMNYISCSEEPRVKKGDKNPSGAKVELSKDVLIISDSFDFEFDEDEGYISDIEYSISVQGYDGTYSYFKAVVVAEWKFEYLNDEGEYVPHSVSKRFELNAKGEGGASGEENVESRKWRHIKDIKLELSSEGYAVKK